MQIAMVGLGRMGGNMARRLLRGGHAVVGFATEPATVQRLVDDGGQGAATLDELVKQLDKPRVAWLMVPAGAATEQVVSDLAKRMEPGDTIVDGGNSFFKDDIRRMKQLRPLGLHYVDVGTSGGIWGLERDYCLMIGGEPDVVRRLDPIFRTLALGLGTVPRTAGRTQLGGTAERGYLHCGPSGSGHFVKMVHNGIEYADMQLIAEAYDLLRTGLSASPAEIADIFRTWNDGDLESFLIEITADVLGHVDAATGRPFIDIVLDQAEQKGTGRWTVQSALDLGVPITGIAEATFARSLSGHADQRAAARDAFGSAVSKLELDVDDVRRALYASKVVAYAQGFDHIAAGSAEYTWGIDRGAMATIWRGGCIIRARFLNRIRQAYDGDPQLPSLLVAPYFAEAVRSGVESWRRVVAAATSAGIPTPAFASSLAYYDGLRRDRLPAALIQGLRDNFGAHTYRRVDREGSFHTDWAGDGTEHAG